MFLRPAISLASFFSSFKRSASKKQEEISSGFILVGDDADVRSAAKILSELNYQDSASGTLDEIKTISNTGVTNIVFCTGKLSYQKCIQFVQENKEQFNYYWHKAGSQSIAGSGRSDTTGKIYNL